MIDRLHRPCERRLLGSNKISGGWVEIPDKGRCCRAGGGRHGQARASAVASDRCDRSTIETTRAQHKGGNIVMRRKDWPTDPTEIQRSIEEAIPEAVRKGWLVDSGQKRWSPRTGRYEIVWESTIFGKTFQ